MGRMIKFRGKRLDNDEWVYGDLEYNRAKNIARIHTYDEGGEYLMQHLVEPESVGQFTGLLDLNGKEIYEGDILKLGNSDNGVCEVKWNEKVTAFCIRFSFENELGQKPLGSRREVKRNIVVLGNIHDNPDLLNGK